MGTIGEHSDGILGACSELESIKASGPMLPHFIPPHTYFTDEKNEVQRHSLIQSCT